MEKNQEVKVVLLGDAGNPIQISLSYPF